MDMRWTPTCAHLQNSALHLLTRQRRGGVAALQRRAYASTMSEGESYLQKFINHERKGVPAGAGTDSKDGFDMVRAAGTCMRSAAQWPMRESDAVSSDTCMQGRMHRLLTGLGDPHLSWPAVHVAGTKGKGSTTAMLASILKAAQYRVGTYTRLVFVGQQ